MEFAEHDGAASCHANPDNRGEPLLYSRFPEKLYR
jgi:hypothetical protein